MPFVSGFLPSRSAPLFHNGPWPPGLDLELSLAGLPAVSVDVTQMGLCGGMSFLARDIHETGMPQLRSTDPRGIPVPVGRHILGRLIDSFLGPGVIPYWLHATQELDHSTWFRGKGLFAETVDAAHQVMRYVDAGGLVPIGVVLAQSPWPWDVFQNHVELVYGYDLAGTQLTLHVYDSNAEGSDNVTITLDIGAPAPVQPIATNGTSMTGETGRIRGFFVLPYQRKDPAAAFVDDGQVTLAGSVPQTVAPGESISVTVTIDNTGSTTFDPARGYRLGIPSSAADRTTWGTARFELAEPLDPGRTTTHSVTVPAPLTGSAPLQLQLLRESVLGAAQGRETATFFGHPTEPVLVTVGSPVG